MPKIAIIIPCINLWNKYTKPCVDSIKTKYPYRVLLIDNNSTDETKDEAGKLVSSEFCHIRNNDAWSCAKSWNFGIKDGFERGFDYILVLNNDILLHPEAIDRLVERFEEAKLIEYPNFTTAMVSCLDVRAECPDPRDLFLISPFSKKDVDESPHPNFSAFMINKECWDKIGEFDEEFYPAYFEDNSYHYKIKLFGMKAICLPTAMFYHFGSGTQNEAFGKGHPVVPGFAFERNRTEYVKMWGGVPGQETYKTKYNK